jgi:putative flippase GtrA
MNWTFGRRGDRNQPYFLFLQYSLSTHLALSWRNSLLLAALPLVDSSCMRKAL